MKTIFTSAAIVLDLQHMLTGQCDVEDELAAELVNSGLAEYVDRQPDESPKAPEPDEPAESGIPSEGETPDPPKRPYGNASKAAWVEYAVAVDEALTEKEAMAMSKADLQSRYGERL